MSQRPSNSPFKVVAFDCDGVLFDSKKANIAYYNQVLRYFGRSEMTQEQFAFTHMHTADEAMAYLFPETEALEMAQSYRKQLGYQRYIALMKMEPNLLSLLNKLRPGFKTAIATNRTDTMGKVLEIHKLENRFDLVICASDVEHPKPHPEPIFKILEYFGVQPDETIYVGDSKVDELAAKAAGVSLAAFRNSSLDASYHIHTLKDLESILGINL
jgi:HAD superfamily hydrolase (TIGR01549 family)